MASFSALFLLARTSHLLANSRVLLETLALFPSRVQICLFVSPGLHRDSLLHFSPQANVDFIRRESASMSVALKALLLHQD